MTHKGPIYFPPAGVNWEQISAEEAGWNRSGLEAAAGLAGERGTSALLILYQGRIMLEKYWELDLAQTTPGYKNMLAGTDAIGGPIEDVASVQKSLVSVLALIARRKGLIHFDDPVSKYLGGGWTQISPDQEKEITIRRVMCMTSGLTEELEYEGPPDTVWRYNTTAYQHLIRVISAATGVDYNDLTREWLCGPLGMADTRWIEREWAPRMGDSAMLGLNTTARDLARFGLMVMAGGFWGESDIIKDPDGLAESLTPSQRLNPAYGWLWWLNGSDFHIKAANQDRIEGPLHKDGPLDMASAQGALNRSVSIAPSQSLVVCRMGDFSMKKIGDEISFMEPEFWKLLRSAGPGW